MDRAKELAAIYRKLRARLDDAGARDAPALARELRIISAELEKIGTGEVSKVDQLAARRKAKAGTPRPPARRRKPG